MMECLKMLITRLSLSIWIANAAFRGVPEASSRCLRLAHDSAKQNHQLFNTATYSPRKILLENALGVTQQLMEMVYVLRATKLIRKKFPFFNSYARARKGV